MKTYYNTPLVALTEARDGDYADAKLLWLIEGNVWTLYLDDGHGKKMGDPIAECRFGLEPK